MSKIKKMFSNGDWILSSLMLIVLLALAVLVTKEPRPEPPPKVQEVTLEDGTKCVVLKGIYSDSAIDCDWKK